MKKNQSIKYILTDVLPAELPLIFSNKNFYKFLLKENQYIDQPEKYKSINKYGTIPNVFKIRKGKNDYRYLSLMHPYSQMILTKFISDYAEIIITYFQQNSIFSVRAPIRINDTEYIISDSDIEEINSMIDTTKEEYNFKKLPIITRFFDLNKYAKITDFYKSYYLKDLEIKYNYMLKMDISNCFNNIYTHSVDWAYLGSKEIAKSNLNNKERFSFIIDEVMQYMNYKETNGILIGPEFSRMFAEIILTHIDNLIYSELKEKDIHYKRHYEIVRFLDDIFVFSFSKDKLEEIQEVIKEKYLLYKLTFNDKKTFLETVPFFKEHLWVNKAKQLLNVFLDFCNNLEERNSKTAYNNLLEGVRGVVVEYESHMGHIISYIITSLENIQKSFLKEVKKKKEMKDVYIHSSKYIDLITQIVSLSISHENIVKVSRMYIKFLLLFHDDENFDIDELIYKKAFLLLNYHRDYWTELQNLVLVLSLTKNKYLPPDFLKSIIEMDSGYLSLAVISFYILNVDRKITNKTDYYEDVYKKINDIFEKILQDCADIYGFEFKGSKYPDSECIDKFVQSDRLYIIHDFYSSGILNSENRKKTEKIKKIIGKRYDSFKGSKKIYPTFLQYIRDFDKPFIQWDMTEDTMIRDFFLHKLYKKKIY